MLGMHFVSLVILLVIGVIVAAVAHYAVGYYAMGDLGSFLSKVVIGWLGAWLGTPVFGCWFDSIRTRHHLSPEINEPKVFTSQRLCLH